MSVAGKEESEEKMPVPLRLIQLSLILLLISCATTRYEPLAEADKEEVTQLNDTTFRVEYRVSPFTSQVALDDFLRRRCAEVTLRQGYDSFVIALKFDALTYRRSASVTLMLFKGRKSSDGLYYDAREVLGHSMK